MLAARHDAVAAAVDEQFGDLTKGGTRRSYDAFGWTRGVQAADRAELHRAVDRRH